MVSAALGSDVSRHFGKFWVSRKWCTLESWEWCQNAQNSRYSIPSPETKNAYLHHKKVFEKKLIFNLFKNLFINFCTFFLVKLSSQYLANRHTRLQFLFYYRDHNWYFIICSRHCTRKHVNVCHYPSFFSQCHIVFCWSVLSSCQFRVQLPCCCFQWFSQCFGSGSEKVFNITVSTSQTCFNVYYSTCWGKDPVLNASTEYGGAWAWTLKATFLGDNQCDACFTQYFITTLTNSSSNLRQAKMSLWKSVMAGPFAAAAFKRISKKWQNVN